MGSSLRFSKFFTLFFYLKGFPVLSLCLYCNSLYLLCHVVCMCPGGNFSRDRAAIGPAGAVAPQFFPKIGLEIVLHFQFFSFINTFVSSTRQQVCLLTDLSRWLGVSKPGLKSRFSNLTMLNFHKQRANSMPLKLV